MARKLDGGESSPPASEKPADEPAQEASAASSPPAAPSGGDKPAKPAAKGDRPSTSDILAMARKKPGEAASEPAAEKKPAGEKPAGKGGRPSTADILAMARKKDADGGAAPAAEKPRPKPKPAAKKAEAAEKPAAAAATIHSSSILAGDGGPKAGPMSKAEAAKIGAPTGQRAEKPRVAAPPMPEKPDYAKPRAAAAKKPAEQESRRGFFGEAMGLLFGSFLGIGFTSLTLTNLLWVLGSARFLFPNILTEPPTKFKVGFPAAYPQGYVENKYKAQYAVWVVHTEYEGQDMIFALSTVCTHLGCTPNWLEAEQKFKCPCHGSGFYKDGINFEGPAPRPLERYAIRIGDDGQLEIDKSRKFQQEMGQWNDPASYVPV